MIQVGDMVKNIRGAFDELLHEVSWMDDHTKGLAKEKVVCARARVCVCYMQMILQL